MMSVDVVLAVLVLVQWPGQYLSTCVVSSFPLTNANKYFTLRINILPPAPCPARGWAACWGRRRRCRDRSGAWPYIGDHLVTWPSVDQSQLTWPSRWGWRSERTSHTWGRRDCSRRTPPWWSPGNTEDKRQSRMAIIVTIAVNVNKTSRNFMVPEEALLPC